MPTEDLAVEVQRLAVVAGGQLEVHRCTGLVHDIEAAVADRLPQPDERAGGIGEHRHVALVLDLHRFDAGHRACRGRRAQRGVDVGGVQVGGPPVRAVPLRVVVHQPGHRLAVLGRVDVAAVFGPGGFECPAEHGAVEVLGAVDVRRRQVNPARGTQRCAFTGGHDGLLYEVAGSVTDIDRGGGENSSVLGFRSAQEETGGKQSGDDDDADTCARAVSGR